MWPAGLAEPADERRLGRLQKDQHRIQAAHRFEAPVDPRKIGQQFAFTHVDDDGRARDFASCAQCELCEHRQQGDRQVVDAEVPEILEGADRLRLAGS